MCPFMEASGQLDSIEEIEKKIADYRKQLQEIKGVQCCPNCGEEVSKGMAFCCFCGSVVKKG